jgi:hypothetical protein
MLGVEDVFIYQAAHFGDRMSREAYKYVLYPQHLLYNLFT